MSYAKHWALAGLLILFLPVPNPLASPDLVDASHIRWAYGTVVDSVTITGNKHTRSFAMLREMETQPGAVLEEKKILRDIRYLNDLNPVAALHVRADSLSPGHTAIRLRVEERSDLFIFSVYPFLNYNFDSGFSYGMRWRDKNFRGRLENLTLSYTRNEQDDDNISLGWSTPWIGWHHIAVGGNISYFSRGRVPSEVTELERFGIGAFLAVPLTTSRIAFSQLLGSLSVSKCREGADGLPSTTEVVVDPLVGFRFDSRDSRIRPAHGQTVFIAVSASQPLDGTRGTSYRFLQDLRTFHSLTERQVIAGLSALSYQFGDFPDHSRTTIGGSGTLRGYASGRFSGHHRWFQTLEWRYQLLPKKIFRVPHFRYVDVGLGLAAFIDGGIVWDAAADFRFERFHGTAGMGLRFFSPFQDVVRLDFGFSAHGDYRFHFGTGIRF
jgi:outer membrane protein insertion porin family